ncbi:MAG: hypothetical protein ABF381_02080 [Akkermansiaceae bacterium]
MFVPKIRTSIACILGLASLPFAHADDQPKFTDYCDRLEQEIQGRKHDFLAGNVTYYVGGYHASWKLHEDETIGLTHPFHHDLRGRGASLLASEISGTENIGKGNDFLSWEFYKDTPVLYGSAIVDGKIHKHPKPSFKMNKPLSLKTPTSGKTANSGQNRTKI